MKFYRYGKYVLYLAVAAIGIYGIVRDYRAFAGAQGLAGELQNAEAQRLQVNAGRELWNTAEAGIARLFPVFGYLVYEQHRETLATQSDTAQDTVGAYYSRYAYIERIREEMQADSGEENSETVEPETEAGETEEAPSDEAYIDENQNQETVFTAALANYTGGITDQMLQTIAAAGYTAEQILDLPTLVNQFYIVNAGTSVSEEVLNPSTLLSVDFDVPADTEEPVILLYHTHSQEAYADSIPGDVSQTVVGMGDYLTELLSGQYGYQVLHNKSSYDLNEDGVLDRDLAYSRALPELQAILEEYPSIRLVIDLHRDGVGDDVHLVTEVDGKPTAQIMYFNGMCRSETGDYPDLVHEYREVNLALSLQLMLTTDAYYPGVSRVIYLKSMRYNQHLCCSALIEVGAQTNTVEEARNAIAILADIIDQVIRTEKD